MAAEAGASAAGGAEQKQKTAMEAWNDLKAKHKHRFVIFKLVNKEVVVDVLGDKSATYKTFISNLPETSCRYAVYDYEFKTKDGRSSAKIYFFTWNPANANQIDRVEYSHFVGRFRDSLPGVFPQSCKDAEEVEEILKEESF